MPWRRKAYYSNRLSVGEFDTGNIMDVFCQRLCVAYRENIP